MRVCACGCKCMCMCACVFVCKCVFCECIFTCFYACVCVYVRCVCDCMRVKCQCVCVCVCARVFCAHEREEVTMNQGECQYEQKSCFENQGHVTWSCAERKHLKVKKEETTNARKKRSPEFSWVCKRWSTQAKCKKFRAQIEQNPFQMKATTPGQCAIFISEPVTLHPHLKRTHWLEDWGELDVPVCCRTEEKYRTIYFCISFCAPLFWHLSPQSSFWFILWWPSALGICTQCYYAQQVFLALSQVFSTSLHAYVEGGWKRRLFNWLTVGACFQSDKSV